MGISHRPHNAARDQAVLADALATIEEFNTRLASGCPDLVLADHMGGVPRGTDKPKDCHQPWHGQAQNRPGCCWPSLPRVFQETCGFRKTVTLLYSNPSDHREPMLPLTASELLGFRSWFRHGRVRSRPIDAPEQSPRTRRRFYFLAQGFVGFSEAKVTCLPLARTDFGYGATFFC
jgi:hypothetical protein